MSAEAMQDDLRALVGTVRAMLDNDTAVVLRNLPAHDQWHAVRVALEKFEPWLEVPVVSEPPRKVRVQIQVDQAVWERSTFEVEVAEGLGGEELADALREAVDDFDGYGEPGYMQWILDSSVDGIDIERKATLPDGKEIDL